MDSHVTHRSTSIPTTLKEASTEWLTTHWLSLLIVQTLICELYVVIPNFVLGGRPSLTNDSMFFQYVGWYWSSTGHVPYLYIADIKPPAIHELAALLALAAPTPYWLALLSALAMVGAVVGTVILCGRLTYAYTANEWASYASGTFLLTLPFFWQIAAAGLRVKQFSAVFGLLCVWLCLRRRWGLAGASAALAAGFWQIGLIFPLVAVGWGGLTSRRAAGRVLAGGLLATGGMLLPFIVAGPDALVALIAQVVIAPILIGSHTPFIDRVELFVESFGATLPFVAVGLCGTLVWRRYARSAWLPVCAGWFLFALFTVDISRYDVFLLFVCAAVGYGLLIDAVDESVFPVVFVVLAVPAIFAVDGMGTAFTTRLGYIAPGGFNFDIQTLVQYYWQQPLPETCYVRTQHHQQRFIAQQLGVPDEQVCRYAFWEIVSKVF